MTSLNFDIYLRSTPERVWAVLTDPGKVPAGRFGMSSHTDWHARHQVPGQAAEDETDSGSAAHCRARGSGSASGRSPRVRFGARP